MSEMSKVYCNNCCYMETRGGNVGGNVGHFCKQHHSVHETSISISFPRRECRDVNGNNDCGKYREKATWRKFWSSLWISGQ